MLAFSEPTVDLLLGEYERRSNLRRNFGAFLNHVNPDWDWKAAHLTYTRHHLVEMARPSPKIDRLIVMMPPRHGKTAMTTIRYPLWRLYRDPSLRVMIGGYKQDFANKLSRSIRKRAEEVGIDLEGGAQQVSSWQTPQEGGVRCFGVGAPPVGEGGDLLVIDDPIRSRKDAESSLLRDRMWDWYNDDLIARLEPSGQVVVIMTRWHEDDLVGRLLQDESETWTVVRFPAIAETVDVLGRKPGDVLWPRRWPKEKLLRKRGSEYGWQSLYQQRPTHREGNLFKRKWFKWVRPDELPLKGNSFVRYWDRAHTGDGGDFTVGLLMCKSRHGSYYVLDVIRGQWSPNRRNEIMLDAAKRDKENYGSVRTYIEQEPGGLAQHSVNENIKFMAGYPVFRDPVSGNKEFRADPFASQMDAGNVFFLRGPWSASYQAELLSFPQGANDDQVDASSGAFKILSTTVNQGKSKPEGYGARGTARHHR